MIILGYFLIFLSGILLNMGLNHLFNYAETIRHPIIARTRSPKLVSTLWGLGYLVVGALILLLFHYRLEMSLDTLFLFLGFGIWAVFLGKTADRLDKRDKQ